MKSALFYLLIATLILSGGIYLKVNSWKECRGHGFSRLYCFQQISR